MSGFHALRQKKAILQITSIKVQSFALSLLLIDAPKIRTESSKQKQTLICCFRNVAPVVVPFHFLCAFPMCYKYCQTGEAVEWASCHSYIIALEDKMAGVSVNMIILWFYLKFHCKSTLLSWDK